MLDDLKELIKKSKVISFDIFDTLITRIVDRPEAVFELMEKSENIPNFSKIRQEKQAEIGTILMKEKNYPHATLDEIYDYISKTTDIKNVDKLKKEEIKLEKELLFPNKEIKEIVSFAKENGKRIIITSDMYLDLKTIEDILKKCGYENFDHIYLSSMVKKAKFDSSLFDYVIKEEKVDPSDILHIGDNYDHDYVNAKNKGLAVYHYKNTLITNKSSNLALAFHNGICRLLSLNQKDFFVNLGAKSGLLYLALFRELISLEDKKIYFLARDGYNLYHLFKKYAKDKQVSYVYASRRAMLIPSITEINDETVKNLPPFTFGQTVEEILDYVSLKEVFTLEDLKKVGISDFKYIIKDLEDFDKVHNLYKNKPEEVLKVCQKERKAALKYFTKLGLDDDNLFFDCGWNGSSQYFLENLLQSLELNKKIKFYYTGILDNAKSRKQLQNKLYSAYLFNIGDNLELSNKLIDNIVILELFFGAPHNSVLHYSLNKEGYELEDFEKDFDYKEKIYQGLDYYFSLALEVFEKYNIKINRDDAILPVLNLIENPTVDEAIKIGDIPNVDGFAAKKGMIKYIAKVTMDDLKENKNTEIYWKIGLLKRPDIPLDVKEFVKKKYNLYEEKEVVNNSRPSYIQRFKNSLKNNGYRTTIYLIKRKIGSKLFSSDDYQRWIKNNEKDIYKVKKLKYRPLISLVVPVYNAKRSELEACFDSVLDQTYPNFELCLVDDCSTSKETLEVLLEYKNLDKRIKVSYHKKNEHISKTTNDGIALATGEFIALLDNDDVLAPNALYEMVKKLNENDKLDFIYSDEDKLTEDGLRRHDPFFKPDWSVDTFNSLMYTCHFSLFRKSLVDKIGGFTVGLDGAQDYDFVMRFTELTKNIAHIPKMLYHWRERVGSIANDPEAKPYALKAIVRLKEESLKRQGIVGKIVYDPRVYQYRIDYEPAKKSLSLLIYGEKENIQDFLSNMKDTKALKDIYILDKNKYDSKIKYQQMDFTNDLLTTYKNIKDKIKTSYVMFYCADNKVLTEDFIDRLTGSASLKHVGLVGAKYITEDNIIINSGLSSSINKQVLNGKNDLIPQYYCRNILPYNTYAVSDELMVINKEKLDNVLEKIDDLELSLGKVLIDYGYFNVVRNDVVVISTMKKQDDQQFIITERDPFLNLNLNYNTFMPDISSRYFRKVKKIKNIVDPKLPSLLKYKIEALKNIDSYIIRGYIFKDNFYKNNSNRVSIILKGKNNCYEVKTKKLFDQQPTLLYKTNLNFVTFRVDLALDKLEIDNYKVYIRIKNRLARTEDIYDMKQEIKMKGE